MSSNNTTRLNKKPIVYIETNNPIQVQSNSSNLATQTTLSSIDSRISTSNNTLTSMSNNQVLSFRSHYTSTTRPIYELQTRFGGFSNSSTIYRVPINDTGASTYTAWGMANDTVRISSTNSADVSLEYYIEGMNSSGVKVSEFLTTDANDGQTSSANSTNTYRSITKFVKCLESFNQAGTVYLSQSSSSSLTSGVPDKYLAQIDTGNNYHGFISGFRNISGQAIHILSLKVMKLAGNQTDHKLHLVRYENESIFDSGNYVIEYTFPIATAYQEYKDLVIPNSNFNSGLFIALLVESGTSDADAEIEVIMQLTHF